MNWLDKYKNKLGVRYSTYKKLFEVADERKLKFIVETGTARGKNKFYYLKPRVNWKDGMSTMLFAEYSDLVKGTFWSCDIDGQNISNAYKFTEKFSHNVNFVIADSLVFLKNLTNNIDILYLDSLDGQITGASEHQLEEARLSINKLNSKGIILLDDKGAKTNLSIPFLLDNKWNIIFETKQQVLLSK